MNVAAAAFDKTGFVRVAAGVPFVRPAEPEYNTERTLALAADAAQQGAGLVVFPELGLSAYAIDDLLHQQALADGIQKALERICEESRSLAPVPVVGALNLSSPDEALTNREREVLELVSQGLSNKLIARRLQISEHTVKFHISSISTKLGASSRTDAVSRGVRRGLITL